MHIDDWRSTSNGRDLDEQRVGLKNYFENNKFRMIYMNTFNMALLILFFVSLVVTVLGIVSTVKSGFAPALAVGPIMMAVAVVALLLRISKGKKNFQKRVDTAVYNLENTMAQIVEFQRYFTENLYKKDEVISKLSYI